MKTTVTIHDFRRTFAEMGRDNFSYEGLGVLFDYIESLEQDIGEEITFDVVGFCCDYAERTPEELAEECDIKDDDGQPLNVDAAAEALAGETTVCGTTESTVVFLQF